MKPARLSVLFVVLLFSVVLFSAPSLIKSQDLPNSENLFYMVNNEKSFQSFKNNVDQISIIAPQVFSVQSSGVVWGSVDRRVLQLAKENNIKVMPLIVNSGFSQEEFHKLLHNDEALERTIRMMIDLGKKYDFYGWQFDYENIHISDRDALTSYYKKTAKALHKAGLKLSIAVVPRDGNLAGPTAFNRYIYEYWRGGYDLKALAEVGDFISLMTYSQHTRHTTPGPIAGYTWVEPMLQFTLDQGVPAEKISLGLPSYSYYWHTTYRDGSSDVVGTGLDYDEAAGLVDRFQAKLNWLDDDKCYYTFWSNDGIYEYLFLEDQRSFEAKLGFLKKYNFRGISVWRLGQEDPATWDVLKTTVKTEK